MCRLVGQDLPASGLQYLSELVQPEVAQAESLIVVRGLGACGNGAEAAASAAREAGANKAVVGRIACLGDLYIVELGLVDAVRELEEGSETVEFTGELRGLRIPVRTAAQRLLGTGGRTSLAESFVHISSTPKGARVLLDGLLEGRAPLRLRVGPGDHVIEAALPGA